MRGVPRLDKSALCLIRIRLVADFLNSDLCAVFGEDNVLLFHLLDAAFSELVGVEEDLGETQVSDTMRKLQRCCVTW